MRLPGYGTQRAGVAGFNKTYQQFPYNEGPE